MFWIEILNRAVREEVRARLDTDPAAIVMTESRRGVVRGWGAVCLAFCAGLVMGWLWQF